MKNKIQAVDLFCGIGGLSYGLRQSGIEVLAGFDLDPTCAFAFEANGNGAFFNQDIKTIKPSDVLKLYDKNAIKILVGCAPCQPFSSHANKLKKNEKDSRWNLLLEFLRVIKEVKPDVVSMENVPKLQKLEPFKQFTEGLESMGYYVAHKISFCNQLGMAQGRRRLTLLASKVGKIDFIKSQEKRMNLKDVIGHMPPLKNGEQDPKDPLHKSSSLSELNLERIKQSKPGGTWRDWDKNLLPKCYQKESGKTYSSVYGRLSWDKPACTITTQFHQYGTGRFGHPTQDRALSLREGALIQSFPSDYQFIKKGEPFSRGAIARHIGNAVPPKLGEVIGEVILKHLENSL